MISERVLAADVRAALSDPVEVVHLLALDSGARKESSGIKILCPLHNEKRPSCQVSRGRDGTLRFRCFGCGATGDVLHLVAAVLGLDGQRDFPRLIERAAELAGIAPGIERPKIKPRPLPKVAERPYPPPEELAALLAACVPAYDDPEIRRDLAARCIDAAMVTDRTLAFALPSSAKLPAWARLDGQSWTESGHRLIVPMYGATGQIVTVRARRLDGKHDVKSAAPAGHRAAGCVMADPLARMLLAGEVAGWSTSPTLIVAEGEPDYLVNATFYGDDENAPAVIGVISSSWVPELAAHIPDGAHVIIRTHHDAPGQKYADEIASTLRARCTVRRSLPVGARR